MKCACGSRSMPVSVCVRVCAYVCVQVFTGHVSGCSGHIAERVDLRYYLTFGMLMSGLFTALFGFGRYWNIHHIGYYIAIQVCVRVCVCVCVCVCVYVYMLVSLW